MERKLRKSYLLMFPLLLVTLIIIIAVGTWVSRVFIRPSMAYSKHKADMIVSQGLTNQTKQQIIQLGGGIMLIHNDGKVESIAGRSFWDRNHMSMQELADFMAEVKNPEAKFKYSVAYDETLKGWIVVGFPVSMRIQIIFSANTDSKEYVASFLFYIVLGLCLAATLFLLALCYARRSAKTYSDPLSRVCNSVRQMAQGNYHVKEQQTNIQEYDRLQEDVMHLAKQLEEEKNTSKQLADSKRQMLLDISHDLRNPLATILGYSESLCREEGLSDQERENYMEVIYRNSMRAHALMNDLFEYTRLEEPTLQMSLVPTDICEFFREFAASYVPDIESAGFASEFDIPEEEWYVMADTKQMERALENIVSNSLRYNPSGTLLKLSLQKKENSVFIHISDDGVGIDAKLCSTIFMPFTRADKARNSKLGGSGLGLSISKKILEAMNGSITLESDCNQGCDFQIILPIHK